MTATNVIVTRPKRPVRRSTFARLMRRPLAVISLAFVIVIVGACLAAQWIAPYDPDAARMRSAIERCAKSEDYREGRRAFMEKRKPRFTGR